MASRSALPVLPLAALLALSSASQSPPTAAEVAPAPDVVPAPPQKPKPRWRVAIVRRTVPLRVRPNGRVAVRAAARTEFGGRRVMSIAAQRGPWLGVVTPELPNDRLAWVHEDNRGIGFRRHGYSLHADLSARRLVLRRAGRRVKRITVAIGRPGSETPTGRFAVTDKLDGTRFGSYYGCCILALNGEQPNLPTGWRGGDRLAIHGTSSPGTIGAVASAGCLRAGDADLRVLMRRVPLGTPVFVRS